MAGSKRSWQYPLVIAAIVVMVMGGTAFFLTQGREEPQFVASAEDAAVDAHASTTKPKPAKKRTGRAGKTHVSGHSARANAPAAAAGTDHGSGGHAGAGHGGGGPSGPSYEAALASNDEHVTIGGHAGADLTDGQLAAPMSDGGFIDECGAPESMSVTVKVAVRMGRAVGVSVVTEPASAEVAGCVDRHVRGLHWPEHTKMDSFVTTY